MMEQIKEISSKTAWDFLKYRHYAGRKPQISVAYGLYVDNVGGVSINFQQFVHSVSQQVHLFVEEYAEKKIASMFMS